MRILLDENFPAPLVQWLRDEGHDVLWADEDMDGWPDPKLLELAEEQGRVLFTLDKDFRQIAKQRRTPLRWGGVVLFRIHPVRADFLKPFVRDLIASKSDLRGCVTVVTTRSVDRTEL